MTQRSNLTVAIATLNRPEGLAFCLDALLLGDTLPGEVIVIDQSKAQNGSPVITGRDSPVPLIYIHQQRLGLSASRNAAIERAAFPIIAFTDDDCIPDRGWVAAINRALVEAPEIDAVTGRVLPFGPETPDTYPVSSRESTQRKDYHGKSIPWLVGTGGNFAFRRSWQERIGKFDEQLGAGSSGRACEDGDFIYRMLRAGAYIRYEPEAVIFHRRQSIVQRLNSRWNYGYGIGAFCGLWLRKLELYVGYILLYWIIGLLREMVSFAVTRNWEEVHQRMLIVRGTLRGLGYGLWVKKIE
jgi:GT2 family glycosyltransferase